MTLIVSGSGSPEPTGVASKSPGAPPAIKLSVFEGPLDLLLHLIRQNEVEITDIPIAEISGQYLSYLDAMRELNLDVVGEYLVMAATLAWIKSRMLLPPEVDTDDGTEIDPRAELIARLLEYQRFKEAAQTLGDRHLLGRDVFDARTPDLDASPESEREIEVGLFELVRAFKEVLDRAEPRPHVHEVEVEQVTVRDRMLAVMRALEATASLEFTAVIVQPDGSAASRPTIVATFLAILELTRLAAIRLFQSVDEACVPEGPIHLRRALSADDADWKNLISENM